MGASLVVFWCAEAHCTFAPSIIRRRLMHESFAVTTRERERLGIAMATNKQMIGIQKIRILAFCDIHVRINDGDHRPRACGSRFETNAFSWGPVHPAR